MAFACLMPRGEATRFAAQALDMRVNGARLRGVGIARQHALQGVAVLRLGAGGQKHYGDGGGKGGIPCAAKVAESKKPRIFCSVSSLKMPFLFCLCGCHAACHLLKYAHGTHKFYRSDGSHAGAGRKVHHSLRL